MIKAVGRPKIGRVTSLIVLSVDRAADTDSAEAYIKEVIRNQQAKEYSLVLRQERIWDNEKWQCADFEKLPLFESVLVKLQKGIPLVLLVIGENRRDVEEMIKSSHISFEK